MKLDLCLAKNLNHHARDDLRKITEEYGVAWDPIEDFPAIMTLHILGDRRSNPGTRSQQQAMLDYPVKSGDVDFYRLTFGALFWLEQCTEWWGENGLLTACASLYAMAHCRAPDAFADLYDKRPAERAVTKWAKAHTRSIDAFCNATGDLLPEPSFVPGGGNTGYGQVLSILLSEIGHTPNYWLWECTAEFVCEILTGIASVKWAAGGAEGENPFSEYMIATKEYHYFKLALIAEKVSHLTAAAEGTEENAADVA